MARTWLAFLLFVTPGLWAAPVATLSSLEGEVTVLRGGLLIPSEKVAEGFLLEPFDTVNTGGTGRADIRLAPGTGVTGVVKLDRDTALFLDLSNLKKEQTAGVELLTGAVTVRLSAVFGSSSLEVRTEVGTFGGTGPAFRVVLGPAGDVLVVATAGKTFCQVENRTVFVEPGSVAEALTLDRTIQTHAVNASTLDSYEGAWLQQRRQIFRDQAAVFFRALASRYQLQGGLFQRAWDRVQREAKDDGPGTSGAVANLRRAAFPLERSLFRVQALRKLLDEGVLAPSLELNRGYAAKDFFRQAAQEREAWSVRLGEARALYRTQAEQNHGDFPKAPEGLEITFDSAYFH